MPDDLVFTVDESRVATRPREPRRLDPPELVGPKHLKCRACGAAVPLRLTLKSERIDGNEKYREYVYRCPVCQNDH